MAITAASLSVKVGSDVGDALSGLKKVEQQVSSTAGLFKSAASTAVGFGAALLGLNALTSVTAGLNAAIFGMNSTLEGSEIAFRSMLGSGEAAAIMLAQIKEFAKTTPFDLPQVLAGAKNLLAFGFSAEEVIPLLRDMGNVSAGLDLGAEGISRMTRALGQMRAKGRVLQEDLNQLQEVGVNTNQVFAIMADRLGTTVPALKELQEAGKLDPQEFLAAFQVFSQQRFGSLMEEQSKTLVGAMSNVRDALGQTGADVFHSFFLSVQEASLGLASFLNSEQFAVWAAGVKTHVDAGVMELRAFGTALKEEFGDEAAAVLTASLANIRGELALLKLVGTDAAAWAKAMAPALGSLEEVLGPLLPLLRQLNDVVRFFSPGQAFLQTYGALRSGSLQGAIGSLPAPQLFPAMPTREQNLAALQGWRARQGGGAASATVNVYTDTSDPDAVGRAAEYGTLDALMQVQGETSHMAPEDAPGQ